MPRRGVIFLDGRHPLRRLVRLTGQATRATAVRVGRGHQLWSIQYLRAIAAMAVIVFHQLQGLPLMWLGEHGVDLFFVISGFMMATMTLGRDISPIRFLIDRITRVVPLYWLATLLAIAAWWSGIAVFAVSDDPRLLIRSLLFIPTYGFRGQIWPTLFLGWTLNYEMFFYLLFACCLVAKRSWRLPIAALVLGGLVLIGAERQPTDAVARVWTSPLLLEFVAGTWLGVVAGPANDRFPVRITAVLMMFIASVLILAGLIEPRLVFGGLSALLVCAGLILERGGLLPQIAVLKKLGDASYSIYLFQAFALAVVAQGMVAAAALTGLPQLTMVRTTAPLGFLVALGLGLAVSSWIERPGTALLRRWMARRTGTNVRLS